MGRGVRGATGRPVPCPVAGERRSEGEHATLHRLRMEEDFVSDQTLRRNHATTTTAQFRVSGWIGRSGGRAPCLVAGGSEGGSGRAPIQPPTEWDDLVSDQLRRRNRVT